MVGKMVEDLAGQRVVMKAVDLVVWMVAVSAEQMVADLAEQLVELKADMMAVKRVAERAE